MGLKNTVFCLSVFLCGALSSCQKDNYPEPSASNSGQVNMSTDKARYNPGEAVVFSLDKSITGTFEIKYKHLSEVIDSQSVSGTTWQWTPPTDDYRGYMAELYSNEGSVEKFTSAIAIDVSSDWSKFPRYGFLSEYGNISDATMQSVMKNLNRHHINGLQFYDWQYKHHMPLAGTPPNPESQWKDIMNRDVYFSTLQNYIELSHACNINTMFYNLAFGALNDASYDGVSEEWYIYTDKNHSNKDYHGLPKPPFKSDIYLLDPGNTDWQNYLNQKDADVYEALNFDGFHIDQLGDRGTRYNYWGNQVNLPSGYHSFIEATKNAAPSKKLVMNAVNQFGQQNIASASVDFLYTEVWSPNDGYADLARIIQNNDALANPQKKSVLAAYMNYNKADNPGYFNTPAVLFTDAVIFAFGGDHLELGEHMLGKEYFPNNNLDMRADLQKALVSYYDFLVAYENILRDGGTFNSPSISSTDGKTSLNQWPPSTGQVAVVGKEFTDKQVVHLINFFTAAHFDWRDNSGNQTYPTTYYNCSYSLLASKQVTRIWFASPDYNSGASVEIPFQTNDNMINFSLPSLTYWDMVVIEY